MKKETLYLLAGGAGVVAWYFLRKAPAAELGGAGRGSGGAGQVAAQPATSYTTNVKPGGGTATVPGRTVGTGGLQSGIALAGNINELVKGVGTMFGDAWKGISGIFGGNTATGPADPWGFNAQTDAAWVAPYPVGVIDSGFGDYTPTGADLGGRSFSLDNDLGGASAPDWGTPDNVVWPSGYENTVSYSDSPWGAY